MKKILALLLLPSRRSAWRRRRPRSPLDHAPDQPARQGLAAARRADLREPLPQLPLAPRAMRYTRLTDLGLTEEQIRDNLLFTGEKVGEPMMAAMDAGGRQGGLRRGAARPLARRALARRRLALYLHAQLLQGSRVEDRLEQHDLPERGDAARALGIPGRPGAAGDREDGPDHRRHEAHPQAGARAPGHAHARSTTTSRSPTS